MRVRRTRPPQTGLARLTRLDAARTDVADAGLSALNRRAGTGPPAVI